jgi:DNA-binding MarR family transcriptional regulator
MNSTNTDTNEATHTAQVLRRFRVVFNTVRSHFQQVEKTLGIGGAQVWALSLIQGQPGIGVGGLAKGMDIHQSTASNLVKSLLHKNLLSISRSSDDRRNVHLHILPAGADLLTQSPGPFEGVLPAALGRLPDSTLLRLGQDLDELIFLLKADEKSGQIPLGQL